MWAVAVAVAVAGSCSSNLTPSLGTFICCRCAPKKKKKRWKIRQILKGPPECGELEAVAEGQWQLPCRPLKTGWSPSVG